MTSAVVRRLAAWAPGLTTEEDWRSFSAAPHALEAQPGAPDARFLPPLVRRRCDDLTRALLHVANACAAEQLASCATVFASRFSCLTSLVELVEALVAGRALSPNTFSHSVHNAPVGVLSVWARNRNAGSSIAAGHESFACGLLEALCFLARDPTRDVLLLSGDEYALAPFTPHARPHAPTHALAMLLGASGAGDPLAFDLEAMDGGASAAPRDLPDTLAFARWWYSPSSALALEHPPRRWVARR